MIGDDVHVVPTSHMKLMAGQMNVLQYMILLIRDVL